MFEELRIQKRKSVKYGETFENRFETAPVNGERKWLSKGAFCRKRPQKPLTLMRGSDIVCVVCQKDRPI